MTYKVYSWYELVWSEEERYRGRSSPNWTEDDYTLSLQRQADLGENGPSLDEFLSRRLEDALNKLEQSGFKLVHILAGGRTATTPDGRKRETSHAQFIFHTK